MRKDGDYRAQLCYFTILPKLGTVYPLLHTAKQTAQSSVPLTDRLRPRRPPQLCHDSDLEQGI